MTGHRPAAAAHRPPHRLPPRARPARRGFTLIELLIVVTIIAFLAAILLPALTASRRKARDTVCLAQLKQIGAALITYENDHGRLPGHVLELTPDQVEPNQVTVLPGLDQRPLYQDYLGVDFYQCPHLPRFQPAAETRTYVYLDYDLYGGYFGDHDGVGYQNTWTKSDSSYRRPGATFNALAGDRLYYQSTATSEFDTIANHAAGFGNFAITVSTETDKAYSLASAVVGYDVRRWFTANYVAADGSARTCKGNDVDLVQLPTRHSLYFGMGGNFLVPQRQ